MSNRLNKERQMKLEPLRIDYTVRELRKLDIEIVEIDNTSVKFIYLDEVCTIWPYSGYHNGKTINAGCGIHKLLNQLKADKNELY